MSAKAFVELLAERQIVPAGTIEQLRKQIAAAAKPIPAAAVAKALLDKQLLTAQQARSLLDSLQAPPATPTLAAKPAAALEDDLGLMPFDDDMPAIVEKKAVQPPASKLPTAKPVAEKPATKPAAAGPAKVPANTAAKATAAQPSSKTDDPLFSGGSDDLFGSGTLGADLSQGSPTLQTGARRSAFSNSGAFWGAIAGSILLLAAVAGIAATRDNGDAAWAKVQATIKESPAETEAALHNFLAAFPHHAQVGQAEVLLAQMRLKELEKRSGNIRDNARTLLELVEPLVTEPAITTVQPQLAKQIPELIRVLLANAAGIDPQNIAGRAELAELARQLWTLGNDPRVIPYESRAWRSWDEYQELTAQLQRAANRAKYLAQLEPSLSSADTTVLKSKLLESLTQFPELAELPEWQAAAKRAGL